MGKKDLTDMLGGGGGRTRQKYRCKADGCQVTPMGVNLAKHYKVNTDWVLLKELKACVGDLTLLWSSILPNTLSGSNARKLCSPQQPCF